MAIACLTELVLTPKAIDSYNTDANDSNITLTNESVFT
jgi:hypothetical protein